MLPVETREALFPSSGVVGKLTLRPMTLAHAALLDALGVDLEQGVTFDNILLHAWVLSMDGAEVRRVAASADRVPHFKAWCAKCDPDPYALADAVCRLVRVASAAFVPPEAEGGGQTVFASAKGFGWPLEVAECLCHEYGWTLDAALDTPLATAYALVNCARQRNGGKNGGPDYYGRVQMAEAARAFRKAREEREAKRKAEEAAARKEASANG